MPRKYVKRNTVKRYDRHTLELALEAVKKGSSIREASNAYYVPYTTLNSHVNNEFLNDKVGRPTKLNMEEERYLEEAVLALQSWGVPLSIQEFLEIVEQYASSLNKTHLFSSGKPTYDWLQSFLHRHPKLTLKKSKPLEKKRAAITPKQIDEWFKLLSKVIVENQLVDSPAQIFNCDETGLADSISYSKVLVHRGTSNAYRIQGGTGGKSLTSVMFCASATGFLLPPFIVYKSKRLYQEWCSGGPPDAAYGNSENGWMERTLFYHWFEQIFLKHTTNLPRPLILILDGHGSHFKVETLKLAVENHVIIVCLPSNTTHILQPLDVVFFNPLKTEWKKTEYNRTNNKTILKARFPSLLKQLWETDAIKSKNNVIKSFMKAGVFPLNQSAIHHSRLIRNSSSDDIASTRSHTINNQTNDSSTPSNSNPPDNDDSVNESQRQVNNIALSSQLARTQFTSSESAINALDHILESTLLNNDENIDSEDDDDNDENYVLNRSIEHSSISTSSKRRQSSSSKLSLRGKKKRKRSRIVTFDTTDDENDTSVNTSNDSSQQSLTSRKESRTRNQSNISRSKSLSKQNSTQQKHAEVTGHNASNGNETSINGSQHSLKAITDTLKNVFSASSKQSPSKTTRRTMLSHPTGRIVTEADVIKEFEEKEKLKNAKRLRSTSPKSTAKKRYKKT